MLNKKNQTIVKTVSYILLIIIAIYCVFPFIWMVISAFKPKDEIRTAIPSFVIHAPTLENFKKVLFQAGFINYIKNSFIVSVIACGLSMVIAVMAGYALSRYYKQKLVKVSNFAMMLSQMIPGVLLLVPLYMIMQKFHILETYLCLILAYTTFVIPLCTFMMSSFFDTVPMALEEAAEIADTINWRKIKNINALVKVGEIYEKVGRYDESKDVLLTAYDKSPIGRMIIYRLAEVAVRTKSFDEAKEYYQEFVEIAPHDNLKYVLKYEISKAQGADIGTLIGILEELKEQEYSEEWAYELAYLYHKAGMSEKCIDACDELILWFGDGPYVERALELKMLYQPLTKQQEDKYRTFRQRHDGVVEVRPEDPLESGEIIPEPVQIKDVKMSAERFNTQNLQEELQRSMQEIMNATEKEAVNDTMDNIKKLVEDIPYLQIPSEKEEEPQEEEVYQHIETDEEIDNSLKSNFQEMLVDEDGQMSLYMQGGRVAEPQVSGQMSIEDVLAEWEKTKRAAEAALQEAEQRKLESAKARALQEAEELLGRLADVIPMLDSGLTPKDLLGQK